MSSYPSNQYATSALKELRSILAGEVATLQAELTAKRDSVHHVDVVLGMIAPEVDPATLPTRRTGKRPYPVPHLTRRVLTIMRRRDAPMTARELAEAVAAEMGFPDEALPDLAKRCRYSARNLSLGKTKRVVKAEGPDGETLWRLA